MSPQPAPSQLTLLHSGADYFPALLAAIAGAQHTIAIETYIFANDDIGHAVRDALIGAAQRGVAVRVTVDGFGSGDEGRALMAQLRAHGIDARIYRPQRWWQAGLSPKLLRRLHRKLCVIDAAPDSEKSISETTKNAQAIAFVGGINVLSDHNHAPHTDASLGPRFDFAVRVQGGMAQHIHTAMHRAKLKPLSLQDLFLQSIALVLRDNWHNRQTIQRLYLKQLATAQHEVWIANAYFLPGRKLRRALLACAQRGVAVKLLLQGQQEYFFQHHATQALYGQLLGAGIQIYEYQASFLHAKVAVFDGLRATVGSSNIDPFSLLLAKEANLWVNDAAFASELHNALNAASTQAAKAIPPQFERPFWLRCLDWLSYGLLRFGLRVVVRRGY